MPVPGQARIDARKFGVDGKQLLACLAACGINADLGDMMQRGARKAAAHDIARLLE